MRSGFALAWALVAIAGCGYAEDEPGAKSPRIAFELFATGVVEREPKASDLVSRNLAKPRRESYVRAVRKEFAQWARGYRIIFDERISDGVAVVAAQGEDHPPPGAYAAVLTREGESWFVEPNALDLIYGASSLDGVSAARPRVDFEVNVAGQKWRPEGRLWLDGNEVRLRAQRGSVTHRFVADIRRLHKRLYSVVAFARAGERFGSIAWTFRAG